MHSLFAEFASFQLAAAEPDEVAAIHRRAAVWLKDRGLLVEAVEHGAAAGDHEFVAGLLVEPTSRSCGPAGRGRCSAGSRPSRTTR